MHSKIDLSIRFSRMAPFLTAASLTAVFALSIQCQSSNPTTTGINGQSKLASGQPSDNGNGQETVPMGDIQNEELIRDRSIVGGGTIIQNAEDHLQHYGLRSKSKKEPPILNVSGSSAKAAFLAMSSRGSADSKQSKDYKQIRGLIGVACINEPHSAKKELSASDLKAAAMGPPAPKNLGSKKTRPINTVALSTCDFRIASPAGAVQLPTPPFLQLTGKTAVAFWKALNVPSKWEAFAGWHEKIYQSHTDHIFRCEKGTNTVGFKSVRKVKHEQRESYTCTWKKGDARHSGQHSKPLIYPQAYKNGRPKVPTAL